jgi:hypothetical protein
MGVLMNEKIKRAHFRGELRFGEVRIPCFVLEDSTRILSGRGVTGSVGLTGRGQGIGRFLSSKSLIPFISNELRLAIENPILYVVGKGKRPYFGYEANILPEICNAVLQAEQADKLPPHQKHMAVQARILIKALSTVGIIALIDEATGYDKVRDREALQKILEKYIRKDLAEWAKRFPDEFYGQMFRLKGWQWQGMKINRPSIVGHYTNDLVYERLAPGVLPELQRLNPPDDFGRRRHKHHQWLTDDIGHPALAKHLAGIVALMRASSNWDKLMRLVKRAFPKSGDQIDLDFEE